MTIDQTRNLLDGSEPFTLRMVSGREYRIEHPDHAALGGDNATLIFTDDKGHIELIRLSQLESVRLKKAPAA